MSNLRDILLKQIEIREIHIEKLIQDIVIDADLDIKYNNIMQEIYSLENDFSYFIDIKKITDSLCLKLNGKINIKFNEGKQFIENQIEDISFKSILSEDFKRICSLIKNKKLIYDNYYSDEIHILKKDLIKKIISQILTRKITLVNQIKNIELENYDEEELAKIGILVEEFKDIVAYGEELFYQYESTELKSLFSKILYGQKIKYQYQKFIEEINSNNHPDQYERLMKIFKQKFSDKENIVDTRIAYSKIRSIKDGQFSPYQVNGETILETILILENSSKNLYKLYDEVTVSSWKELEQIKEKNHKELQLKIKELDDRFEDARNEREKKIYEYRQLALNTDKVLAHKREKLKEFDLLMKLYLI